MSKASVYYHLPDSENIIHIEGSVIDLTKNKKALSHSEGFVINSFDNTLRVLVQAEKVEAKNTNDDLSDLVWPTSRNESQRVATTKDQYLNKLDAFKDSMVTEGITKAIFSRVISVDKKMDVRSTFLNMVQSYPKAFCYCISSMETGTWMGATPEKLFNETADQEIQIHSLAGTQPASDVNWSDKEYEEQQIVTDYILNHLSENNISQVNSGKRETIIAGAVAHLRTTITFPASAADIDKLIDILHPTPAVCGTPKEKAISLIRRFEDNPRDLYAGFLGTVGKQFGNHLFVNLRCMEVTENGAELFVGGGITSRSIPENEWTETELKSRTLLNVIS